MTLDRSRYELEFDEDFSAPALDPTRWLAFYLPQWSSHERSAARFHLENDELHLRIDGDQPAWAPEVDGDLRVSNLQTGVFSGPVSSDIGQHRTRSNMVVREEQPELRLYTPRHGLIEIRMKAIADPRTMVALWMIGFEKTPDESGEICIAEIFGSELEAGRALVGLGVHPHNDDRITDDFEKVELEGDATDFHLYSVEWLSSRIHFFIDDELVKTVEQAIDYPMQLMLDVFEFEPGGDYPKEFIVDFVRGYRMAR